MFISTRLLWASSLYCTSSTVAAVLVLLECFEPADVARFGSYIGHFRASDQHSGVAAALVSSCPAAFGNAVQSDRYLRSPMQH